jgi:hypothetical protein
MSEKYTEKEAHRHFAGQLNGEVWSLLEKPDRSKAEDELMIHAAHASCYHWQKVGTGLHHQRGVWLLSHVYAELGIAEAALWHARRCQELTDEYANLMQDFDRAYAHECMARANALAGNREEALRYLKLAEKAGQIIADEESKKFFLGDLNSGNWHGLR